MKTTLLVALLFVSSTCFASWIPTSHPNTDVIRTDVTADGQVFRAPLFKLNYTIENTTSGMMNIIGVSLEIKTAEGKKATRILHGSDPVSIKPNEKTTLDGYVTLPASEKGSYRVEATLLAGDDRGMMVVSSTRFSVGETESLVSAPLKDVFLVHWKPSVFNDCMMKKALKMTEAKGDALVIFSHYYSDEEKVPFKVVKGFFTTKNTKTGKIKSYSVELQSASSKGWQYYAETGAHIGYYTDWMMSDAFLKDDGSKEVVAKLDLSDCAY